mgnify:CR=1 FL=1
MDFQVKKKGFSLIEVLITALIFSTAAIAIYSAFSLGMKVWRRANDLSLYERKVILKMEKFRQDLRQSFVFKDKDIAFWGDKNKLSFPLLVDAEVSRVTYSLDRGKKEFLRAVESLKDILEAGAEKEKPEPEFKVWVSAAEDLSFSYFYFDLKKNKYLWKEGWQEPGLPAAVKVNLVSNNKTYSAVIFIPSS